MRISARTQAQTRSRGGPGQAGRKPVAGHVGRPRCLRAPRRDPQIPAIVRFDAKAVAPVPDHAVPGDLRLRQAARLARQPDAVATRGERGARPLQRSVGPLRGEFRLRHRGARLEHVGNRCQSNFVPPIGRGDIAQCVIGIGTFNVDWRGRFPGRYRLAVLEELSRVCSKMRMHGATGIDIAYVGAGILGGAISFGHHIWDHAAGVALVRGAGGVVTDLAGAEWTASSLSSSATPRATSAVGSSTLRKGRAKAMAVLGGGGNGRSASWGETADWGVYAEERSAHAHDRKGHTRT